MSKYIPQAPGISPAAVANRRKHVRIRRMTDGRCFYCGTPTIQQGHVGDRDWLLLGGKYRLVREHAVPTSRGGDHGPANFVPACSGCNYTKGPFTLHEFRMVRAFQTGAMNFRFWGEQGPLRRRDWIMCGSAAFERQMVERNLPSTKDGYELRRRAGQVPLRKPRIRPVLQ